MRHEAVGNAVTLERADGIRRNSRFLDRQQTHGVDVHIEDITRAFHAQGMESASFAQFGHIGLGNGLAAHSEADFLAVGVDQRRLTFAGAHAPGHFAAVEAEIALLGETVAGIHFCGEAFRRLGKVAQIALGVAAHIRLIRNRHRRITGAGSVEPSPIGQQTIQIVPADKPAAGLLRRMTMIGGIDAVQVGAVEVSRMPQAGEGILEHAVDHQRMILGLGVAAQGVAFAAGPGNTVTGGQIMIAGEGQVVPLPAADHAGTLGPVVEGHAGCLVHALGGQGVFVDLHDADGLVARQVVHIQLAVIVSKERTVDRVSEILRHPVKGAQRRIALHDIVAITGGRGDHIERAAPIEHLRGIGDAALPVPGAVALERPVDEIFRFIHADLLRAGGIEVVLSVEAHHKGIRSVHLRPLVIEDRDGILIVLRNGDSQHGSSKQHHDDQHLHRKYLLE